MRSIVLTALLFSMANTFVADVSLAGDWPQILGPTRNGIACLLRVANYVIDEN